MIKTHPMFTSSKTSVPLPAYVMTPTSTSIHPNLYYSYDLTSWSSAPLPSLTLSIGNSSLTFFDGAYYLGAYDTTLAATRLFRFTDPTSLQEIPITGVTAGNSRIKKINGTIYMFGVGISYSVDGINFSSAAGASGSIEGIASDGSIFVAVGDSNNMYRSEDGVNFSKITPPGTGFLRSISYFNGLFIAGGQGARVITSADGTTWTTATGTGTGSFTSMAASPSRLCILPNTGSTGIKSAYTDNGSTFSTSAVDILTANRQVVYNGSQFIAVGGPGSLIRVSTNASNWTTITRPDFNAGSIATSL